MQKRCKDDIQCALLNTGDVYTERATLAPRFALIFRGRIAYNAGYCRSLYFQRMPRVGRRELRAEREKNRQTSCIRTYVILRAASATHCACTCVRCYSFNLGNGRGEQGDRWGYGWEKKFIAWDAVRRVHNPHNALFTLVPCVASESAEIVYIHTFVGAVKRLCTACFQSVYSRCFYERLRDRNGEVL